MADDTGLNPRRNLTLYLAARFAGALGIQIQSATIAWEVYERTNEVFSLAWVGLAQFLPLAALSLYAGGFADRHNRRLTLTVSRVLYALGATTLALLSMREGADVTPIYGVLVGLGATRAFAWSAGASLLPNLVTKDGLPRAVALSSTAFQTATISGPALGGLLIATVGSSQAFLLAGGLSLVAAGLVYATRPRPFVPEPGEPGLARLLGGLRFVADNRILLGAIGLDLCAVLLGGSVALLPVYAKDILHAGTFGYGLMRSAPAVGALLMAVILARWPLERRAGAKLLIGVALFGACTIVFALSKAFWLSIVALICMGAADMVSVIVRQSLIQLHTPDGLRGRVSAVNMVFIGASNELGEFESGVTAGWFGTVRAAALGGIGTLLITGIWAAAFPQLRAVDRLEIPSSIRSSRSGPRAISKRVTTTG